MIKKFFKNKKSWVPALLIILSLLIVMFLSNFNFGDLGYSIF
ncbi:hypothetical protein OAL70_01905 [Pelagibacteraceae bacterium]|nr:hypothetical protein [Pelagibacteraceae bacterium]